MRIIGISSNGRSQKNVFHLNTNRGKSKGDKTSFWGQHESLHGGYHQNEGQLHGGGQGNFRGRGSRGGHGGNHQGQQLNSDSNYYYYRKPGHMAKELLSKGTWCTKWKTITKELCIN